MNYGSLISDAFWLTWRNKFLWFFGLFAGGGTSFNFNVPTGPGEDDFGDPGKNDFRDPGEGGSLGPPLDFDPGQWIADNLGLILASAAVVVLLVLVLIALSIISQGALVDSVAAIQRGEARRFSSTWRAGLSHFWRVLGLKVLFLLLALGILLVLVIAAPMALAFWAVFSASPESVALIVLSVLFAVLLLLVMIVLLVVVFVPLTIVNHLALRELVLGRERIVGSIRSGFGLFRRNLGRSLLVWIILVALTIGAGIALLIVGIIAVLTVVLPVVALLAADLTAVAVVVGVVAGALIVLIPFLVISGAIGAFGSSYWTLAYLRLATPAEGTAAQPEEGM